MIQDQPMIQCMKIEVFLLLTEINHVISFSQLQFMLAKTNERANWWWSVGEPNGSDMDKKGTHQRFVDKIISFLWPQLMPPRALRILIRDETRVIKCGREDEMGVKNDSGVSFPKVADMTFFYNIKYCRDVYILHYI